MAELDQRVDEAEQSGIGKLGILGGFKRGDATSAARVADHDDWASEQVIQNGPRLTMRAPDSGQGVLQHRVGGIIVLLELVRDVSLNCQGVRHR